MQAPADPLGAQMVRSTNMQDLFFDRLWRAQLVIFKAGL